MGRSISAIFLALSLLLNSNSFSQKAPSPKELQRYDTTYLLFDTVASVTGYADSRDVFDQTARSLYDLLTSYERLFDVYQNYEGLNNLKTVNDNAGGQAVAVDRAIIDLLLFCRELAEATDGRLDVTAGSVLSLWHETLTSSVLPSPQALTEAALHTGFDLLEIDEVHSTVRLTDPLARLEVGAVAGGFTLEQIRSTIPDGFLINLGGFVLTNGTKPDGSSWKVGVRNPEEEEELLCAISVQNAAVSTSGDYERCCIISGVRYHHIIDLDTLYPSRQWRSVSVLHPNAALAEGLSTALFLLSYEEGAALAEQYSAQAMWVSADGSVTYSDGFTAALAS